MIGTIPHIKVGGDCDNDGDGDDDEDDHRHLMFNGNYGDDDENLTKITTTIRQTKHQND